MAVNRREAAFEGRVSAAKMAHDRVHPDHIANGDEQRYATAHYPMSFTKGLDHIMTTGLVANHGHFEAFRHAIDEGWIEPFTTRVPVPITPPGRGGVLHPPQVGGANRRHRLRPCRAPTRKRSPCPPAPELRSDELAFEMAEVYELALLRDLQSPIGDQKSPRLLGGLGPRRLLLDSEHGELQTRQPHGLGL